MHMYTHTAYAQTQATHTHARAKPVMCEIIPKPLTTGRRRVCGIARGTEKSPLPSHFISLFLSLRFSLSCFLHYLESNSQMIFSSNWIFIFLSSIPSASLSPPKTYCSFFDSSHSDCVSMMADVSLFPDLRERFRHPLAEWAWAADKEPEAFLREPGAPI